MTLEWEVVIGLEIHAQLATRSKIFSSSSTAYGAQPNSQANLVDLGYPGVLPVLNGEVVKMAVKFGLAVNCEIARRSVFARKNYFYPDLPKGYQISQFELPVVGRGEICSTLDDGSRKRVGITRAHLEEDAGKSLHEEFQGMSGIDLNRAGTPLLEIVSEPDMRSPAEASAFLRAWRTLLRYLEVSDADMQKGQMRCDANVSIRPRGSSELGTRTELKNLNSFRFVEMAIAAEIDCLGIDYVEGGWPGANPTDDAFFADPPKLKRARLTAFGMTRRQGRSAANDPGLTELLSVGASVVCMVGKAWDFHVEVGLGITREENLKMIADSFAHAATRVEEVMFDAEHFFDGYKANPDYALACLEAAAGAGARWIVLCDTNGGTLPDEIERIVERAKI